MKHLIQTIDDRLGKNAALGPKDNYPGDYVRVTTINAGAGLESPIVFLVGLRLLFEQVWLWQSVNKELPNLQIKW